MGAYTVLFLGHIFVDGSSVSCESQAAGLAAKDEGLGLLKNLAARADYTVASLKCPVVDPVRAIARGQDVGRDVCWSDPAAFPELLRSVGVSAVRILDAEDSELGELGVESTQTALARQGIWTVPSASLSTELTPAGEGPDGSGCVVDQDGGALAWVQVSPDLLQSVRLGTAFAASAREEDTAGRGSFSGALFVDFEGDPEGGVTGARLYPLANTAQGSNFVPRLAGRDDAPDFLTCSGSEVSVEEATESGLIQEDDLGLHLSFQVAEGEQIPAGTPKWWRPEMEPGRARSKAEARNTYTEPDLFEIRYAHAKERKGLSAKIFTHAGEQLAGATTQWFGRQTAISALPDRSFFWVTGRVTEASLSGLIVGDKIATSKLLREHGVAVPESESVTSAEEAVDFFRRLNAPIVVKPQRGAWAKGVSVNLASEDAIREAYDRAAEVSAVMVEQYIPFEKEFRCVTTPDECVAVVERMLPRATGDGSSTIQQLIDRKNVERKEVPSTYNTFIPSDEETVAALGRRGYGLDSVLPEGETIIVREVGGLSRGGEPRQATDTVPDEVKDLAVRAAQVIPGLDWSGVDIVLDKSGNPYVIEINTNADATAARFPHYGPPVDVGSVAWGRRYARSVPAVTAAPADLPEQKKILQLREIMPFHADEATAPLGTLLNRALANQGWTEHGITRTVKEFTKGGSRPIWLANAVTPGELSTVIWVLRRHRMVRRLLHAAGVPIPKASRRRFATMEEASVGVGKGLLLALADRSWTGSPEEKNISQSEEQQLELGSLYLAQSRPRGARLAVLADPQGPIAIFSAERVSEEHLVACSRLGTEAVRAIPELRWASVSIVIPKTGARPMVEGMSVNPAVRADWVLVAGSIPRLWNAILGRNIFSET